MCTGIGPEEFDDRVTAFFERSRHPDRGVSYLEMRYRPMLELVDELRAHDFDVFIVTGGGAEFVRAVSRRFYDVSPDAVVGSLVGYEFARDDAGRPTLRRTTQLFGEVNEGAPKVTNIQLQLGRRPIFAAGNSPGDAEMLEYALAVDGPSMALLVNHDDADREYAYEGVAGSFETDGSFTEAAVGLGITIVSMRDDWADGLLSGTTMNRMSTVTRPVRSWWTGVRPSSWIGVAFRSRRRAARWRSAACPTAWRPACSPG